jgi:uncharacterized MnhB-related membrane protein
MSKGFMVIVVVVLTVIFAVSTLSGAIRLDGIISNVLIGMLSAGFGYYMMKAAYED